MNQAAAVWAQQNLFDRNVCVKEEAVSAACWAALVCCFD